MPEKNDLQELGTPVWTPGTRSLGVTYTAIRPYLAGAVLPTEDLLLRTVGLIVDDLPALRAEFPGT